MASVLRLALQPTTALTTTTTASSRSLEVGTGSFVGWLNVSVINPATTANCKIQMSADDVNFVDAIVFTAAAGAVKAEAIQFTGGLLPHVRAVSTLAGVTQAATIEIALYFDKSR